MQRHYISLLLTYALFTGMNSFATLTLKRNLDMLEVNPSLFTPTNKSFVTASSQQAATAKKSF